MNRVLHGISASPGIVVGPVRLLRWEVPEVPHRVIDDDQIEGEIARFRAAVERATKRLQQVKERAELQAGEDEAEQGRDRASDVRASRSVNCWLGR